MLNGRLKVGENSSPKETDFHQSVINVLNSFGIPQSELSSRVQDKKKWSESILERGAWCLSICSLKRQNESRDRFIKN
jgi:hypothetical protein